MVFHQVKSPELKEVQDTSLAIMREARARTADLKQSKIALDAGKTVIAGRKEDLVERLNQAKLVEMESKVIDGGTIKPQRLEKMKGGKRAAA